MQMSSGGPGTTVAHSRPDGGHRGGDKLTPRAVQQQHRHSVGVEDLLHPRQQLGEKIISAKVGQRRIGNRPDIPELALRTCWRTHWRHHQERLRLRDRAPALLAVHGATSHRTDAAMLQTGGELLHNVRR